MICSNCKKQIADDSNSCPYCGSAVDHPRQVVKEISFRRYQRWFFYAVISISFCLMIGTIVLIFNKNSEYLVLISTFDEELKQKEKELSATKDTLAGTEASLQEKDKLVETIKTTLTAKEQELKTKLDEFKKVTDEQAEVNEKFEECQLNLGAADANIYNLIIEIGEGVSNENLNKIPLANANFIGKDTDEDGLSDAIEIAFGTDPAKADTDEDGYDDKSELLAGYNPLGEGSLLIDENYAFNQKGKILIQVEGENQAWYIGGNGQKYFLGSPADAFRIMRDLDYWNKKQS